MSQHVAGHAYVQKTSRGWYVHASQMWKNQKPSKAHAQCRHNEMLAASAKAKEHGRGQKCVAAIRVMDCRLWGLSQFRVSKIVLCSEPNVQRSSGLPNLPKGRKSLGTSELEKMNALNLIYSSRKLQKIRFHGAAYAKETLENHAKVKYLNPIYPNSPL